MVHEIAVQKLNSTETNDLTLYYHFLLLATPTHHVQTSHGFYSKLRIE